MLFEGVIPQLHQTRGRFMAEIWKSNADIDAHAAENNIHSAVWNGFIDAEISATNLPNMNILIYTIQYWIYIIYIIYNWLELNFSKTELQILTVELNC